MAVAGGFVAQDGRKAQHALVADDGHFCCRAIFEQAQQRHDGRGWKVNVVHGVTGLTEHRALGQVHQFQVGRHPAELGHRQCRQQLVLKGAVGLWHGAVSYTHLDVYKRQK